MKKTVKGFTLVELIVVVAIFGLIMAAALNLMLPVSKMMSQADAREGGLAAVNSISTFMQNELSAAQYLQVYDEIPKKTDGSGDVVLDEDALKGYVQSFYTQHYAGIIRSRVGGAQATPTNYVYGRGKVHVMLIDEDSSIKCGVYTADFGYTDGTGKKVPSVRLDDITLTTSFESVINKAYTENYDIKIKFGSNFISPEDFDSRDLTDDDIRDSLLKDNLAFTALTTQVKNDGSKYQFLSNFDVPLVNADNKIASDLYYIVADVQKTKADGSPEYEADGTPKKEPKILSIKDSANPNGGVQMLNTEPVLFNLDGNSKSFVLIYSFSFPDEIITK